MTNPIYLFGGDSGACKHIHTFSKIDWATVEVTGPGPVVFGYHLFAEEARMAPLNTPKYYTRPGSGPTNRGRPETAGAISSQKTLAIWSSSRGVGIGPKETNTPRPTMTIYLEISFVEVTTGRPPARWSWGRAGLMTPSASTVSRAPLRHSIGPATAVATPWDREC